MSIKKSIGILLTCSLVFTPHYTQFEALTTKIFTPITQEMKTVVATTSSLEVESAKDGEELAISSAYIEMKNIQQFPELPSGCEVTSLTIVLNHFGYTVGKMEMAQEYLPTSDEFYKKDGELYGPNQNNVFVGDPKTDRYGCYAPVIVETANSYLKDNGNRHEAINRSGSSPQQLYDYVLSGTPVLVWATIDMEASHEERGWRDSETGACLTVMSKMHCLVLVGVEENTVTFNDPYDPRAIVSYPKSLFEKRYSQLNQQVVVIQERS